MIEKGLLSFIENKLDAGVAPEEIKLTLIRAGFPEKKIDGALDYVYKNREVQQDLTAQNDFLPKLSKSAAKADKAEKKDSASSYQSPRQSSHQMYASESEPKGLFQGRLRQKDFILGFLFFFGLGYIALILSAIFLSFFFPELWATVVNTAQNDQNGLLLLTLPLILFPVSIMMFSLTARRLHDLEVPGGVSLMFLVFFIPPGDQSAFYGIWVLYAALMLLFIMLLVRRGSQAENEFGAYPVSEGSFFRRIFNV